MSVITEVVKFEDMSCGECGIQFFVPYSFYLKCKEEGPNKVWYCPNGHPRIFTTSKDQEIQKLRQENEQLEKSRFALQEEVYQKNLQVNRLNKSIKTRNKRLKAGLCPCCNRTFKQLAEHMKSKHPDYAEATKPIKDIHKKINKKSQPMKIA